MEEEEGDQWQGEHRGDQGGGGHSQADMQKCCQPVNQVDRL